MSDAAPIVAEPAAPGDRRRLLIDLASSYALSVARVASMAAMIAIFYRYTNTEYAATFILVRAMLGLLNNLFAGINPTTQRWLAAASHGRPLPEARPAFEPEQQVTYRAATRIARREASRYTSTYALAAAATIAMTAAAALLVSLYASTFTHWHEVAIMRTWHVAPFAACFGAGLLARLAAEPSGALLQSRGRLAVDNTINIAAELAWPLACLPLVLLTDNLNYGAFFTASAGIFLLIGTSTFAARYVAAAWLVRDEIFAAVPRSICSIGEALRFAWQCAFTAAGSLADFLYAPTNVLIISAFLHPRTVTDYVPALQFDAALLLLVGAIAATILPRAMRLAGDGRTDELRALYVRSTLVSLAILAAAAIVLWVAAPTILRVWLGQPMPVTLSVLPLVLVHTVVGGTAGVGRATLLAMGRFRAYTVSAVIAGVANVALALLFVVGFGWGLRGVALATIIAVVARCAIWMPWYVLRATRAEAERPTTSS